MDRIQNFEELEVNELRRDALAIAEAGFKAINTEKVVRDKVQVVKDELRIGNASYKIAGRKVFYVGVGKCAISAGRAIEKILGGALTTGVALDVSDTNPDSGSKIKVYIGTHPLPSEANVRASQSIIEFLSDKTENDLVIFVISGGGSTLLCLPDAPSTKSDLVLGESELFKELTEKGAPIQDLNTVRKHISRARGGALAVAAYPAEVISLIFSDVPGNDIHTISSGPTILDSSTVADAQAVLAKYGITAGTNIQFIETQKDEKYFKRVTNTLILSNQNTLSAMKYEAVKRGYTTTVEDEHFAGEARDIGRVIVEKLHASSTKTAFLYAGESTVTLDTGGPSPRRSPLRPREGGRNQEMALAALEYLNPDELILPFASDGRDNTAHAGAIADETTRAHAREKNLSAEEFMNSHRSYDFFKTTGDALITGYTGSNVSDLIVALKK